MYKAYQHREAPNVGAEYCKLKNVKGLSKKALDVIGSTLQKFDEHDLDGNGTLDAHEILEKLKRDDYYGFATEADVEKFLKQLDLDGDNRVDRDEWIRKTVLSWANRTYIREFLDVAKKGRVEKAALLKIMVDDGYVESEMIQFIEKQKLDEGDGIDFKKFLQLFFDVERHQ